MWPLMRVAWTALGLDAKVRLPEQSEVDSLIALFRPLDEFTKLVRSSFDLKKWRTNVIRCFAG